MTLDEYEIRIDQVAAECLAGKRSTHEVVAVLADRGALATLRMQLLSDSDVRNWGDLLLTGLFASEPQEVRLALFLVTLDIERQVARLGINSRCATYEGSRLLAQLPALRDFVREDLISATAFKKMSTTDVVQVPGGFARLDAMLNPCVAAWAFGSYEPGQLWLRLDPREGGPDRLPATLCEYVVRPPNPTWWKNVGLRRGTTDGGHFILDPESAPEALRSAAHWEYGAKGIRRLEVFVKRENQGRFSMMVEELSDRHQHDGIMIGRCIHLDSFSPEGTPFDEAVLKHIDLAINVYQDGVRQSRLDQRLDDGGKIVDASCRTHLLRIDGPLFPVLFDCALGFLQSKTLLFDWLRSQFPSSKD
jgi:hypothetical protein